MKTSYNLDSTSSSLHSYASKQQLSVNSNESYYRGTLSYSNASIRVGGLDQIRSKAIACQNAFVPLVSIAVAAAAANPISSIEEECMEENSISVVSTSNSPIDEHMLSKNTVSQQQQKADDCSQFSRFFNSQQEAQIRSQNTPLQKTESNEQTYSDRMICSMRENMRMPSEFLKNHSINPEVRAKMIDWMIEVTSSYGCSDQTFFLSVFYMDQFFERSHRSLTPQDLHLTGVASMFIACKYEEIYPLHLNTFFEKIGHKKLPKEDIKRREQEILHAINFDLSAPSVHDFITVTVNKLNLEQLLEPLHLTFFKKMCSYLSKLACHEYKIQTSFSYATIAGAIIYVSFKILQQMNSNFDLVSIIQQVIAILNLDNEEILKSSTQVLSLARNFERLYPNLLNLKKNCADIQSLGAAAPATRNN